MYFLLGADNSFVVGPFETVDAAKEWFLQHPEVLVSERDCEECSEVLVAEALSPELWEKEQVR